MKRTKTRALLRGTTAMVAFLGLGKTAYAAAAVAPNIETVVITGSLLQATDVKQQAPVLLDIAPLDQIRSLPDVNAAEALQRLPGISLESDSGEGRFINIRGMDADLNGTTYDGVRLTASNPASPQSGARAVAFDAFPAGILGGVEVIKSLTPDLDAEGLGGIVNIQPRTIPQGEEQVLDASIGGGIESLRGTPVYRGDITAGKRFFNDKVAVIVSYAYAADHRGIDDVEADYINDPSAVPVGTSGFLTQKAFDDVQYRWYQYHRIRQGYGGGVTFTPNDSTTLYLRGFHGGYAERATKHEFVIADLAANIQSVDNTTGDFTSYDASSHYADITTKEELGNDLVEVGGNTLIGDMVQVDARLSWTQGYDRWPYSRNVKFFNPNPFDVVYNSTNPKRPVYDTLGGINLADPSLYTVASGSNSPESHRDTEYGGVLNLALPLDLMGNGGVLKFGGSLRDRRRGSQQYASDLNPVSQNLTDYVSGPDVIYYNGEYNLGPQPDYAKLLAIPQSPVTADPSTFEHDNENVYAGYVQYSTTFGKVDTIAGLRIEKTDGTYRANAFTTDATGNTVMAPNVDNHSYTNFFPDISFKYAYNDMLQFRFAFSTAIARPGFNQITASRTINLQNATPIISQGNPDLKPTIGRNVDLYASYLLPNQGILSGGLFYKAFSDYIIPTENLNATDVPGFVGTRVDLISYSNVGSAHAEGVELEYNQQFMFLPGLLSGLGVDTNLTYVESRGEIRPGEQKTLPQTSPFNYNAAVFYNYGPVYLKLAASYVSTNLWAVGGDAGTDLYSQPRFRLDFGATYDITEQIQVYLDVKNITNTHLQFTQTKGKDFPVQNEFYDRDYLAGVRFRL
jgi:TonB-dependent receptor